MSRKKSSLVNLSLGLLALVLAACGPAAAAAQGGGQAVAVDLVSVEFGQGSPFPVNAVIGVSLPEHCAQISTIRQTLAGREFQITIEAQQPAGAECLADSLPYRLSLPLNMAALEHGRYTVTVNGVSAEFDFPPAP